MKKVNDATKLPEGILSVQLFVPDMFGNDILLTRQEHIPCKSRSRCKRTVFSSSNDVGNNRSESAARKPRIVSGPTEIHSNSSGFCGHGAHGRGFRRIRKDVAWIRHSSGLHATAVLSRHAVAA